jgi:hypothetical protein
MVTVAVATSVAVAFPVSVVAPVTIAKPIAIDVAVAVAVNIAITVAITVVVAITVTVTIPITVAVAVTVVIAVTITVAVTVAVALAIAATDWECGAYTPSNKGRKYCTMCASPTQSNRQSLLHLRQLLLHPRQCKDHSVCANTDAPALVAKKMKVSKESAPATLDDSAVCWIGGANDGPKPPTSVGEVKNINHLEMGVSKLGGGWHESNDNHTTTMAGDNKWWSHVANDKGIDKEGKGGKAMAMAIRVAGDEGGHGVGNEGGVQPSGGWQRWQERWWWWLRESIYNKEDGNGNGNDMGNGNRNEGGRQWKGQSQGRQGQWHWQQGWRVTSKSNGNRDKGGERATATRARAMAMAMATIWAIAT